MATPDEDPKDLDDFMTRLGCEYIGMDGDSYVVELDLDERHMSIAERAHGGVLFSLLDEEKAAALTDGFQAEYPMAHREINANAAAFPAWLEGRVSAGTLGLTRAQWRVLAQLRRRQGINQTALAEILEIETITLGRHIDRLADKGWVERRADPADRRAWRLYLDDKAQPVLDELRTLSEATRDEALEKLAYPAYEEETIAHEFEYIATKLGISVDELQGYLDAPKKTYRDYRSQESVYLLGAKVMRLLGLELGGKR